MTRAAGLPGFVVVALLLVAALFSDALFSGRVLSQADILFDYAPWSAHRPEGFTRPGNDLLADIPQVFYPFLGHTAASLKAGALPLWSVALFGGHPFLASFQSATFSPFTLAALVLPAADALLAAALARLLVGGIGMWLFLRRLGLSRAATWFGAMAYLLNPFSVVWIEHPVSAVSAWLPLLLWSAERLLASHSRRDVALLAVVVAIVILAGHPETSYKVLLFGGAYVVTGLWRASAGEGAAPAARLRASVRALAICFAPAAAIGLLLASIQVVPFAEYLLQSFIWEMRRDAPANVYPAPPQTLVTAIVPNFFGNPSHHSYVPMRNAYGWVSNFCEQQLYPGVVTWVLAVVGLSRWRRAWRVWFFAGAALAGALIMCGTPGVIDALHLLPGARMIVVTRFGLITITAAIVLAAYGVEALVHSPLSAVGVVRAAAWTAVVLMVVVAVAFRLAMPLLSTHHIVAPTLRWSLLAVVFAGVSVLLVWLRSRGRLSAVSFAVAATACLIIDLFALGWRFHPTIPRQQLFPTVPEIALVKADPGLFRVAGVSSALVPNAAMAYGLQDVRGYDGMMPAVHGDVLGPVHKGGAYRVIRETAPMHLLDLMNVKYVFGAGDTSLPSPHFTRVFSTASSSVFRNERVFPRAFLVSHARLVSPADSLRLMRGEEVDLRREVLLHEPLDAAERPDDHGAPGSATIVRYQDTYVEVDTVSDGRRLLVLGDLDYPGWRAEVDGEVVRIRRANRGLRAVAVPAGRHRVTFHFAPWSVRAGAALSLAAGVGVLGLAWSRRR